MSESNDIVELMNDFLCDLAVFYQKIRNYHWNVKGPSFFALHVKFEELYTEVAVHVDSIAERILGLHGRPRSTMGEFLEYSNLEEDLDQLEDKEMVRNLRSDIATLLESVARLKVVADEEEDDTTINILDTIQDSYEGHDWMFAAFLG